MSRPLEISVDLTAVNRLADALGTLDAATLGMAAMTAVNAVADDVYEMVRPRMIATINLPDSYLQERMQGHHASAPGTTVSASIVATGSKLMFVVYRLSSAISGAGRFGALPWRCAAAIPYLIMVCLQLFALTSHAGG